MEDDFAPRARPLVDVSNDMKLCMHNIVYLGRDYEYRMSNHVDIRRCSASEPRLCFHPQLLPAWSSLSTFDAIEQLSISSAFSDMLIGSYKVTQVSILTVL